MIITHILNSYLYESDIKNIGNVFELEEPPSTNNIYELFKIFDRHVFGNENAQFISKSLLVLIMAENIPLIVPNTFQTRHAFPFLIPTNSR